MLGGAWFELGVLGRGVWFGSGVLLGGMFGRGS